MINNVLGWLIFVVAAVTYLLTIEPTASFWDCPEFIAQAMKSEVGHPPGNPIFILAGRFAANFAGGDVTAVARCVNAMSALLSAGTILLLFWTITHMVKKLVVRDGDDERMTLAQYLVVMGSGVCGALAYTWSDTFWFSAVEAEVYAFSSFCTALVVWLMLKWEDRADDPGSDRWLILIAYVFGFSLGVHLLNLLCIPALALIFYYRKFNNTNVKGSLITLLVSFAVIVLILWGLEPGFVELSGYFDLFAVNTLGLPYNTGVIIYALVTLAVFGFTLWQLHKGTSDQAMRVGFFLSVFISGIPFIGESMLIPLVILVALGVWLFKFLKRVPVRIFSNVVLSIAMIFVGFSCYGLILIRSNANTPLDENSPGDMFALTKYLSRDQYGSSPLVYGQVYTATPEYQSNGSTASTHMKKGARQWARQADPNKPDEYIMTGYAEQPVYPKAMCMLFPRIWSSNPSHVQYYDSFFDVQNNPFAPVSVDMVVDQNGNPDPNFSQSSQVLARPSQADNMKFFFGYQLNYMYFRYFMWNFAGRQNDIQGLYGEQGDVTRGNWITGFSAIDNARLGDQSLLPADHSTGNKGHNVFYCLPLLLGIIGLLWQAFAGKRGIEQFWVVFFLFFMTGIAIVLYLNQTPLQPRERDYAYAGSFYAWTIWVGMGVAGLWRAFVHFKKGSTKGKTETEQVEAEHRAVSGGAATAVAAVAAVIGLLVPLQMVSQTWDDHDRSGRYACHDFGMNYLSSVDQGGIIFTNGDNDTFPLWYLQEAEGYRTDVRVVNLSYLATDWYISQMQRCAYESKPLPMLAGPTTYAYGNRQGNFLTASSDARITVHDMLTGLYDDQAVIKKAESMGQPSDGSIVGIVDNNNLYIPANLDAAVKAGIISPAQRSQADSELTLDLGASYPNKTMTSSDMMALDIISTSIEQGWKRPVYYAATVDNNLYKSYVPYLRNCGMAYQVTPLRSQEPNAIDPVCNTDKMYKNVTERFLWGGLDKAEPGSLYLDETVRRMVNTTRSMMLDLAGDLAEEADSAKGNEARVNDRVAKALNVLQLMTTKLPEKACPYNFVIFGNEYISARLAMAKVLEQLSKTTGRADLHDRAVKLAQADAEYFASYVVFQQSLPGNLKAAEFDGIVQDYYPRMMLYCKQIDPKGYDALLAKLQKHGLASGKVNGMIEGLINYQQQQMQQAQQQAMQQAQAAPAQGEDDDDQQQPGQEDGQGGGQEGGLMGMQGSVPGFGNTDDQQPEGGGGGDQ